MLLSPEKKIACTYKPVANRSMKNEGFGSLAREKAHGRHKQQQVYRTPARPDLQNTGKTRFTKHQQDQIYKTPARPDLRNTSKTRFTEHQQDQIYKTPARPDLQNTSKTRFTEHQQDLYMHTVHMQTRVATRLWIGFI